VLIARVCEVYRERRIWRERVFSRLRATGAPPVARFPVAAAKSVAHYLTTATLVPLAKTVPLFSRTIGALSTSITITPITRVC
jgi:hypothetical protein